MLSPKLGELNFTKILVKEYLWTSFISIQAYQLMVRKEDVIPVSQACDDVANITNN